MRVYLLCLLSMTIVAFSACQKDSITPNPTVIVAPPSPPLFPLAVGNTWVYERHAYSDNDTVGIIDTVEYNILSTTVIDGETYYPISSNEHLFYGPNPYFRKQNGEYLRKVGTNGIEHLFLKDSSFVGDRYVGNEVKEVNKTITTPAGTFNQVTSIQSIGATSGSPIIVYITDRNYQAGVGMVSGKRTRTQSFFTSTTTIKLLSYTLN